MLHDEIWFMFVIRPKMNTCKIANLSSKNVPPIKRNTSTDKECLVLVKCKYTLTYINVVYNITTQ